ncbi:uncharacterized protein LOC143446456 isoform X1 [Clavelina lepadiformis]|uniref:uncharacterized protein LOC143446456 isoform X1 n=2 Tax=Clavelina lepadiformis TaxID=159417 RepID=UPI004041FAD7
MKGSSKPRVLFCCFFVALLLGSLFLVTLRNESFSQYQTVLEPRHFSLDQNKTESFRNFSDSRRKVITEKKLRIILNENCDTSIEEFDVSIGNETISMTEYKDNLAREFVAKNANPGKKSSVSPTLRSYENLPKPNPNTQLRNVKEVVDMKAMAKNIEIERKRRIALGDDDLLQIKEVVAVMENETVYKVPNLVHFIWFGCRRFRVDHYITLLGAFRYQNPKLILFHTDCEPESEYWVVFKKIAGATLRLVKRSPPLTIWGIPIKVVEHRADVARLQIMLEVGGIYLDTDSIVLRSVDSLRMDEMTLSEENVNCLANGMIFANRHSWFLQRWYWEYKYFVDAHWGKNSVLVPWAIWKLFPDKIKVVKKLICRPNWTELSYIFHELYDWHQNYILHLYARYLKTWDGKEERSLKELAVLNTTYGQIARHVIWGDERVRDVTDWIVTCNISQILES